jgi:hypothetical protein
VPSAVRVGIRSCSTSASPPSTTSINRPVLVPVARLTAMTGDIEIYPDKKILSALALVHALRTAGKPVRDVHRGQGGGCCDRGATVGRNGRF